MPSGCIAYVVAATAKPSAQRAGRSQRKRPRRPPAPALRAVRALSACLRVLRMYMYVCVCAAYLSSGARPAKLASPEHAHATQTALTQSRGLIQVVASSVTAGSLHSQPHGF